jgi:hypothetical protein
MELCPEGVRTASGFLYKYNIQKIQVYEHLYQKLKFRRICFSKMSYKNTVLNCVILAVLVSLTIQNEA